MAVNVDWRLEDWRTWSEVEAWIDQEIAGWLMARLRHHAWNFTAVAKEAGVSRSKLYRLLGRHVPNWKESR